MLNNDRDSTTSFELLFPQSIRCFNKPCKHLEREVTKLAMLFYPKNLTSHLILETHGWNVAPYSSIFLMITTQRLCIELAVRDGFF